MLTYTHFEQSGGTDFYNGYDEYDEYEVSSHCRNYLQSGNAGIMSMDDYSMCDSCRHHRQDNRCGLTEKTLA
jgi:hypothetical protein